VGENRSNKAQQNGWTWRKCIESGEHHLCAIQLFEALEAIGIDLQKQRFVNLWDDDGVSIQDSIDFVVNFKGTVVAMGRKVEKELTKLGISHKFIFHPAARGKIRRKGEYKKHVKERLG
jgi:hypothetical protein